MSFKKLKILFVIPGPAEGHSMIFAKRQADAIERKGVDVRKFFLKSRISPYLVFREFVRLFKEFKKFTPDIIHAQYGTVTAFLCSLFLETRVVITLRGSDINFAKGMNPLRSLFGKILSHISILRADAVICVSENLKKHLWWGKKKAIVIPSGVDSELFRPVLKNEARERLGLTGSAVLVLFNRGGGRAVKRMDLAEEALKQVKKNIVNAELLVLDGTIDPSKVYLYYNAADCLLVTSDSEGSPNVVKEALACNLPVVSVCVGDVRERLEGVFPSKIVSRTPACIADAVLEVLLLGKRSNGREKVLDITDEKLAKLITNLYRKIVA